MANTTGKKWGGRGKGTPNKHTQEIREAYKQLIEMNLDNMTQWISTIAETSPEKAIDLIVKLSDFVIPKLNRTEIKDVTNIQDLLELTPQERQARILELSRILELENK